VAHRRHPNLRRNDRSSEYRAEDVTTLTPERRFRDDEDLLHALDAFYRDKPKTEPAFGKFFFEMLK